MIMLKSVLVKNKMPKENKKKKVAIFKDRLLKNLKEHTIKELGLKKEEISPSFSKELDKIAKIAAIELLKTENAKRK